MRITSISGLLKIPSRNVFRNRRRTLLVLAVLVAGGAGMIVVGGFFESLMLGLREKIIHSQSGHLQVAQRDFYRLGIRNPLEYLMKDVAATQAEIERTPHVLFTVPRISISGMVSTDKTSLPVMVTGTNPLLEKKMGDDKIGNAKFPAIHIVEGRDLTLEDTEGALVGRGLMNSLGLKVGDSAMLLTTREKGALDGRLFRIIGVFETALRESDNRSMKINLSSAQKLLGAADSLHSLQVILDKTENTNLVRQSLSDKFQRSKLPLEVVTWEEMASYYRQTRALFEKVDAVILCIFCVVIFFSVSNVINMSLMERVREFGTMMAIGNSRTSIFFVILTEALLLGIIGSALGLLTAVGFSELISAVGIEMPPPPHATTGYYARITLTGTLVFQSFAMVFLATMLASIVPAWRAVRFRIVEALGYV